MALSVIGAGFGRTGTMSLKLALEALGFGPCYHMKEVFGNLDTHVPIWMRAAEGKPVDWEQVFSGYVSAVDFPAAAFYAELAERYPDAKVILTVRAPEKWYKSFRDTIAHPLEKVDAPQLAEWAAMVRRGITEPIFNGNVRDKDHVLASLKRHNDEVVRTIPAERLLVYEVSQGWEPLCAFLGVGIPSEAFPRTNSTEEWLDRIGKLLGAQTSPAA